MPLVEAAEGEGNLLGGRMIDSGSLDCAGRWIGRVRRCMRTGLSDDSGSLRMIDPEVALSQRFWEGRKS